MTLPYTDLEMSEVNTEIGNPSTQIITLNDTNVRILAGVPSGTISMGDLRGKSWTRNVSGTQSSAACYSAQSGFSIDYYNGQILMTMGAWPTDPPNCQTCSWTWLQFNGTVSGGNNYRRANNIRPYWTNQWTLDVGSIPVGTTVYTRSPNWPYTLVGWTYAVYKVNSNTIQITNYGQWGTGDTGTTISVINWNNTFRNTFGTTLTLGW